MTSNAVKFIVCVDDTEHARVAVRLAAGKAARLGANLDLLHVIDTKDFQNFLLATSKMREEKKQEAEELLLKMSEEAGKCGIEAGIIIKEGVIGEKIVEAVEEDINANMLIVGASPGGGANTRKLITWLTTQLGERLLTPIMIVPGNLTDQQIKELM